MKPQAKVGTRTMGFRERALSRVVDVPGVEAGNDVSGDLFADTFWGLNGNPLLSHVPEGRETNHALQAWVEQTDGWRKAIGNTRGNLPATIATAAYMHMALSSDQAVKAALELAEKAAELQEKQAGLEAAAEALKDSNPEQSAAAAAAAAGMAGDVEAARSAAAHRMDAVRDNAYNQAVMRRVMDEAGDKAAEVNAAYRGWGHGAGNPGTMDPAEALEFLDAYGGKVQEILNVAGRVRGFGSDARAQTVGEGVVPVSVTMRRSLGDLLPSEAILLTDGVDEAIRERQWTAFLEGGLLGYEYEETEEDAGPFVAAVDVSGSMYGRREIVAKGVALGCAQIARESDDRPYMIFSFSSDQDVTIPVSSDDGWRTHIEWAQKTIGGGTDFGLALDTAIASLEQMDERGHKADIMFVSDGDAGVDDVTKEKWLAYKAATGARLIYIGVNSNPYMREIDELADLAIFVDDVTDDDSQKQIAGTVATFIQ